MHPGFAKVTEYQLQKLGLSLDGVAEDQDIGIGFVIGSMVEIHQHVAPEFVPANIETVRIGFAAVVKGIRYKKDLLIFQQVFRKAKKHSQICISGIKMSSTISAIVVSGTSCIVIISFRSSSHGNEMIRGVSFSMRTSPRSSAFFRIAVIAAVSLLSDLCWLSCGMDSIK